MATSSWNPQTRYPPARRDEQYHDTYQSATRGEVKVADPYHWLEESSGETDSWVQAQAAFTESFLKQDDANREVYKQALTENYNYARFSAPSLKGDGYYYHSFNSGLQAQAALYRVKQGSERAPEDQTKPGGELFFDPNLLSTDGTTSLSSTAFSHTGKYWAYGLSFSGSDWVTVRVRKTDSPHRPDQEIGKDEGRLEDQVKFVKFSSITWLHDDSGFFYARYPDPATEVDPDKANRDANTDHALWFHKSEDVFIIKGHEATPSQWMFGQSVSDDGRYLELSTSRDTARSNLLWIADLEKTKIGQDMDWHKIVDKWGDEHYIIANDASLQYIATTEGAPRRKIVTYDLAAPGQVKTHIAEDSQGGVLKSIHVANDDALILVYTRDVKDEMWLYDLKSGERKERIGAELVGSIDAISGKRHHDEFFFTLSGFVNPGQVYRYQFKKPAAERLSLYRSTKLAAIDPEDFKTKQVFFESKDGTRVPMFVVSHKNYQNDGTAPAILYGYGGFSIDLTPMFSPAWITFISLCKNGVLAVANLRGGGEYGEEWHQAGIKERKQNVFDDFQAAARYLKDKKIAGKIAISGGSNGGLLVAACTNQAPELFDAAVADVGVIDMLRFHLFTIGAAWAADYSRSDDPVAFDYLVKYSPLHNVDSSKTYPPVMLLNDDRVVPLHSFKLAAELQHKLPHNPNPLLLRVELKAGHGAGKSTQARIREAADRWSFVAQTLGIRFTRPHRRSAL